LTWLDKLQAAVLLAAAPFLLFPTVRPWATGTVCLLIAIVLLLRWRIEGAAPVTPLNGALTLWLAMIAIGALVSAFPDHTLPKLTGLLLGAVTWLTLVRMGRGAPSPRLQTWLRAAFVLVTLGIAGLGLLTTDWPSKIPGLATLIARLPPTLVALPTAPESGVHANQLGGAVVPALALALSLLLGTLVPQSALAPHPDNGPPRRPRTAARRIALSLTTAAIAGLLLLTQSRSAWIGALVSCGVVAALWARLLPPGRLRTALRAGLGIALLGAVAGALWLGPAGLARLWEEPAQLQAVGGVNTLSFRFEVWRWALTGVQDFFFTGCGLGAFREVGRLLYPMNIAPGYDYAHAHNIFLQVALDTGVPGLIAYLATLAITLRQAWTTARAHPDRRAWALGLLGGLIALHTFGLTDAIAPGAKPGLIFWMMVGMVGRGGRGGRENI
jgi:putative inorganic carbon (hco3(-)) transporter